MNKISELIKIKSGMASFVNLQEELFDVDKCRDRIYSYKPIASHRNVFHEISKSIDPKGNKVFFISGSYGTGKSHLCLMLSYYFMHESGVSELKEFFSSYHEDNKEQATLLLNKRSQGKYLVIVPDYSTSDDFEEVILKSLDKSLKIEGIYDLYDSHFKEVLRLLDSWEDDFKKNTKPILFFKYFKEKLNERNENYSIEKLREELLNNNSKAYKVFIEIYKEIIDRDFSFSKDNVIEILKEINSSKEFQKQFLGIVIVFDEFGYILSQGKLKLNIFMAFTELCKHGNSNWGKNQLIFISTGHKSFNSYSNPSNAIDYSTISDRIKEIALQTEGMEEIISSLVIPQKSSELWKKYIEPSIQIFNRFSNESIKLKIFKWLNTKELYDKIILSVYPMHPLALHCLIKMANIIGSDNRTIFEFFSQDINDPLEGSYVWFIKNNSILDDEGKLIIYTTNFLFNYFKEHLYSDNVELRETFKNYIKDYEETVRLLKKFLDSNNEEDFSADNTNLLQKILKVMLIHEITGINNKKENIRISLNLISKEDEKILNDSLDFLSSKAKIIYSNYIDDTYEFTKGSPPKIDELIAQYKSDSNNIPKDIIQSLDNLFPRLFENVFIEAKSYNQTHNEDKRLLGLVSLPSYLLKKENYESNEISIFRLLEILMKNESDYRKSYEGVGIFVICEDYEAIDLSKNYAKNNDSDVVVIGIPNEPFKITEAIFNLEAVKFIKKSEGYENFSTQEKAILNERGNYYEGYLKDFISNLFSCEKIEWFGKNAKAIFTDKNKPYDIADKIIPIHYYEKSNKFSHEDFNKIHDIKLILKNNPLKEAVEELISYNEEIAINTEFAANKGDIRYLSRCFFDNGVLRQVNKKSHIIYCEPEKNISIYENVLPSLAFMIKQIKNINNNEVINLNKFFNIYKKDFGQGQIALLLEFAFLIRFFKDNIRIKRDEMAFGFMNLIQFEEIVDLLKGNYPNAIINFREISIFERNLINKIYEIFSLSPLSIGENASVGETFELMKNWWNKIPNITKNSDYYKKDITKSFINLFSSIEKFDDIEFILKELQNIYGFDKDVTLQNKQIEELIKSLSESKKIIDAKFIEYQEEIKNKISNIFRAANHDSENLKTSLSVWLSQLDNYQKNIISEFQTENSRSLLNCITSDENLDEIIFKILPCSPGFNLGTLESWIIDKSEEYLNKIKNAKKIIEDNKIMLSDPMITFTGEYSIDKNKIEFTESLSLRVTHPENDIDIFITKDGSDPKKTISPSEKFKDSYEEIIKGNKKIKFVCKDQEGNFSKVLEYNFIDEASKYMPVPPEPTLPKIESVVTYVFPNTDKKFQISLKSLLKRVLSDGVLSEAKLKSIVEEVLIEIFKE